MASASSQSSAELVTSFTDARQRDKGKTEGFLRWAVGIDVFTTQPAEAVTLSSLGGRVDCPEATNVASARCAGRPLPILPEPIGGTIGKEELDADGVDQ